MRAYERLLRDYVMRKIFAPTKIDAIEYRELLAHIVHFINRSYSGRYFEFRKIVRVKQPHRFQGNVAENTAQIVIALFVN